MSPPPRGLSIAAASGMTKPGDAPSANTQGEAQGKGGEGAWTRRGALAHLLITVIHTRKEAAAIVRPNAWGDGSEDGCAGETSVAASSKS